VKDYQYKERLYQNYLESELDKKTKALMINICYVYL